MENASKALIIAGAILVSILIIGVGVLIISSMGNVNDEAGKTADTMAIQSFNSKFTTYESTSSTASQVKSLLSLVKSSNAANGATTGNDKFVEVTGITTTSALSNNATYTVEVTEYSTGGYVSKINISKN